jgi:hypothetical protein
MTKNEIVPAVAKDNPVPSKLLNDAQVVPYVEFTRTEYGERIAGYSLFKVTLIWM